ncbi:hypothetical protein IWQ51_000178 [Labrenzia sp. EL_142]|nr:hypothetical protein [Labrenzia sp. EL_142]
MAKGQKRSNRETRKPKKAKSQTEVATPTATALIKGNLASGVKSKKK